MKVIKAIKNKSLVRNFYKTMMLSFTKHTLNLSEFIKESKRKNVSLFVVIEKKTIVGTGSLFFEQKTNKVPFYASIHRISVHPTFRKKGIGTHINKQMLLYAKKKNCHYIYNSSVLNLIDSKTKKPNLGQLKISLNKIGYKITGFRLLDLPDFNSVTDEQFISTAVVWKSLTKINSFEGYESAKNSLLGYYNNPQNLKILNKNIRNNKLKIISKKKTGAILACSTDLNAFSGTSYLPCYFLPYYSKKGETIFFGYSYKTILTTSKQINNPANVNYKLLERVITDVKWIEFLKKLQKQIPNKARIRHIVS